MENHTRTCFQIPNHILENKHFPKGKRNRITIEAIKAYIKQKEDLKQTPEKCSNK